MAKWFLALFCLALAVGSAVADDRASLLGIWKLVALEVEFQDTGERRPVYEKQPTGYLIFTPEGRMMTVIEGGGRKPPRTDDDRALLFRTMSAYSGLYRLEAGKWITAVDVAWIPSWTGSEQVRFYKLESDGLIVTTAWGPAPNSPERVARSTATWVRVK